MNEELSQEEDQKLLHIYEWLDSVQFSRPKKNIARDFCDGVLMAELIKSVYPTLVDLHNYPAAHNSKQKQQNWSTLNRKCFKKLNISVSQKEIDDIINCKQFSVEQLLAKVYNKIYAQDNDKIDFTEDLGKKFVPETKAMTKEEMVKAALKEKDAKIGVLSSTLEVLQLKLKNSEDENARLLEKISLFTLKLANKK